jgi:hypothetical protein
MTMRIYSWVVLLGLVSVSVLTFTLLHPRHVQAQGQPQYPIMEKIADRIVQKYQSSTCEQLWVKKSQKLRRLPRR